MPFSVYFEGCTDATVLVADPYATLEISAYLTSGHEIIYSWTDFGFVSSDPTNCPLSSFSPALTVAYCYDTGVVCTATLLANYWKKTTAAETIDVYRDGTTDLTLLDQFTV